MKKPFADVIPKGVDIAKSDRHGKCQLNPAIEVVRVDSNVLTEHGSAVIQRVAKAEVARKRR